VRYAAELSDMPVLITGGGGFIGRSLAQRLISIGADVHLTLRRVSDAEPSVGPQRAEPHAHLCDITDPPAISELVARIRPSVVFHAAKSGRGRNSLADAADSRESNEDGTRHLLQALRATPETTLVHFGSAAEYAPSETPLPETAPAVPTTAFGETKLTATEAVRTWAARHHRKAVIVRPFRVYGRNDAPSALIPVLLRATQYSVPVRLTGGRGCRDYIYVDDVIEGSLRAVAHASSEAPIVNLGTGHGARVDDVVEIVERVTGRPVLRAAQSLPSDPVDEESRIAETTRCFEMLGWRPAISLEEGISRLSGPNE